MAKWKDLEAQGVRRCCAHLNAAGGGTRRCRRRTEDQSGRRYDPHDVDYGSFCKKHAVVMQRLMAPHLKAISDQAKGLRDDDGGDE